MNIAELDLDDAFQDCFTTSSGPVSECNCGREHVCITSMYFDEEDEDDMAMVESYKKRAETDDMLILYYEYDAVSQLEIDNKLFVADCECEGWKPYQDFILTYRNQIRDFLIKVSNKAQIALAHEKTFNVLRKTQF